MSEQEPILRHIYDRAFGDADDKGGNWDDCVVAGCDAVAAHVRAETIEQCVAVALRVADDYYAQANKRDAAGYLCDVSTGASKAAEAIRAALKGGSK